MTSLPQIVSPAQWDEAPTGSGESCGLSVFVRDRELIFRTYFTDPRGVETLGPVWSFLDATSGESR